MFCVPQSVKTKETNPTRPGSPTPCKQALTPDHILLAPMKIQSVIFLTENLANTYKFHDTWVFSFSGFSCLTEILQSPDSDEEVSQKKKKHSRLTEEDHDMIAPFLLSALPQKILTNE